MENNIYIYNNSFNSLLNLIEILFKNNIKPYNIKDQNYNANLLDNLIYLNINSKNIDRKFIKYIGLNNLKIVYYVYISTEENKELIIYYYLLNALKYNDKVIYMRNLKCISEALKISKYVSRENHRFKGFTRFKELNNKVLYAEISPDNNILYILSNHFKKRFKNEYWIIKDTKREIISLYDKKNYYILNCSEFNLVEIIKSDTEEKIEDLWKSFYKTIGINERKNDRCRMNFMPKKYWNNLVEVSDEIEKSY